MRPTCTRQRQMWVQQFEDLAYHARTLHGQIGVERPFDARQFFELRD